MKKMNIDEALKKKLSGKLTMEPKKKTVHTTFKLSQEGHNAIRTLCGSQGKNVADVFALIVEAVDAFDAKTLSKLPKALEGELLRKTYVIRKDTLVKIGEIAKSCAIDRDVIVENMCLLLAYLDKEKTSKDNEHREYINKQLSEIIQQIDNLEKEVAEQLGKDDSLGGALGTLSDFTSRLSGAIEKCIKTGEPIDSVDFIYG